MSLRAISRTITKAQRQLYPRAQIFTHNNTKVFRRFVNTEGNVATNNATQSAQSAANVARPRAEGGSGKSAIRRKNRVLMITSALLGGGAAFVYYLSQSK